MTTLKNVFLRENVNPLEENGGLEKHGRSKVPGTFEVTSPDFVNGRWRTGLDEYAPEITRLPAEEKIEKQQAIVAKRKELEMLTGLDLSPMNHELWQDFRIYMRGNQMLDPNNPMDVIKLSVLEANVAVAPDKQTGLDPEFKVAKYYLGKQYEEVQDRLTPNRMKRKVAGELSKLLESHTKSFLVAKYLRLNVTNDMPLDNLELVLQDYIDSHGKEDTMKRFSDACAKTSEELQIKLTLDDALRTGVIRLKDGYYQRGTITYGKSEKEALEFLSSIQNSGEFESVKQEIEEKRKFG